MQKRIEELVDNYFTQNISYSIRFPKLRFGFIGLRRLVRKIKNLAKKISRKKGEYKKFINVRHQSVLMRKLGNVDMKLQENKTVNINLAIQKLDGIIIHPGETFSFWELVEIPTYKKGYLDGVLINHGGVSTGVGGGLCQLSNLLYWMFLHLDVEVVERHRHSYDIFPDSGRVLPFASGATVFYNYVDLQVKNTLDYPIQIKLWTNDKYLKGQILSDKPREEKYHVYEKFHTFIEAKEKYFRYNLIHREKIVDGKVEKDEKILENFAPVKYEVDENRLKELGYTFTRV